MLLTIHNLPASTRYADIKLLLQSKCGLEQVILDNLASEGSGKRVTVGVAEEEDAAILVRKVNGLFLDGQQLFVELVRQKKTASEQPFHSTTQEKFPVTTEHPFQSNQTVYGYQNQSQNAVGNMADTAQPFIGGLYYVPYQQQDLSQNFALSGQVIKQSGQSYRVDGQNYGQNDHSYGEGGQNYGQDDQRYRQSAQNHGPNDQRYGQSAQKHGPNGQSYGEKGQRYEESGQSYGEKGQRYEESDQSYGQSGRLFGQSVQNYMQKNQKIQNSYMGVESTQQNQGGFNSASLLGTSFPQPKNHNFDKWGNKFDDVRTDEYADRSQNFPQTKTQHLTRQDKWGNQNIEQDYESSYQDQVKPIFERRSLQSNREDWTSNQNERRDGPSRDLSRNNREQPLTQEGGILGTRGRPERQGSRKDLARRSIDSERPSPAFRTNKHGPYDQSQFSRPERTEREPREGPEFGRSSERDFPRERPSRLDVRGVQRKRKFDETDQSGRGIERPQRLSRPDSWKTRSEAPKQFRPNQVHETGPKKFTNRSNNPSDKGNNSAPFKRPNNVPFKGPNKPVGTLELGKATNKRYYEKCRTFGVNKITDDIQFNLGIHVTDAITKEVFDKFVTERVDSLFGNNKRNATSVEILGMYRAVHGKEHDSAAYNIVLSRVAARKVSETRKIKDQAVKSKPAVAKPIVSTPAVAKPTVSTTEVAKPTVSTTAVAKPTVSTPAVAKPTVKPVVANTAKGSNKPHYQDQKPPAPNKPVPNYPGGDKKNLAKHKKDEKEGNAPAVAPAQKSALDQEIDLLINKVFAKEFDNSDDPVMKRAYDSIQRHEIYAEIRTLMNMNLSRRVANGGLKVLRVYGTPSLPSRASLEHFLRPYGAVSLRKPAKSKMYTAAVEDYMSYDTLCAMGSTTIDCMTVAFKPMHLTAKRKANQQQLRLKRKRNVDGMIDRTGIDLLSPDWPDKMAAVTAIQAAAAIALKAKETAEKEREAKIEVERAAEAEKQANENAARECDDSAGGKRDVNSAVVTAPATGKCDKNSAAIDSIESAGVDDESATSDAAANDKCDETSDAVESKEYGINERVVVDDENKTEGNPESNTDKNYLNDDFRVIDEIHDTDSDVECLDKSVEIVNLDDDEYGNGVENDASDDVDESTGKEVEIDDVDFDIDDVNDDDLEDY